MLDPLNIERDLLRQNSPTEEEFKSAFRDHQRFVEETISEGDQTEVGPTLSILAKSSPTAEPTTIVVGIIGDFSDRDIRRVSLHELGERCFDEKMWPMAVFLSSEVNMTTVPNPTGKVPTPQEVEQVMLNKHKYETKRGIGLVGMAADSSFAQAGFIEIERDYEGCIKPGKFGEIMDDGCGMDLSLLQYFWQGFLKNVKEVVQKQMREQAKSN
jgi:hypothetical protein